MGIDYIVGYGCEPKNALTLEGLMGRLKGRDRAEKIIQLYREQGDSRPPSQMGFEMVRRLPDGTEEVEMIIVQQLLDTAEELTSWGTYCTDCPANLTGRPFGCVGTINYPISIRAERWLLDQLPDHEHPLVFMLLQRAIREMGYTGESAVVLRQQKSIFLQSESPLDCDLNGVLVNGNQVFEMLFMSGHVQPTHGALLLQFFGGISPDLDAGEMMQLADPPSAAWMDEHIPFRLAASRADDTSVAALKSFFKALYSAYRLGVPLLLDV